MAAEDIDEIIFIGDPVNYKPIRDRVVAEPGIAGSMEFNPMTAVSEGAAKINSAWKFSTRAATAFFWRTTRL